jgi:hypothetical protein
MEIDVWLSRSMTTFAGHPQDRVISFESVLSPWEMFHPCGMALEASNGHGARKISAAIGIKGADPPFLLGMKPGDRKFIQKIPLPGKVDLVVGGRAILQVNP